MNFYIAIEIEKSACLDFGTAFTSKRCALVELRSEKAKLSVTYELRLICVETRRPPGVMLNFGDVSLAAAQMNTRNSFGPIGLLYGSNI